MPLGLGRRPALGAALRRELGQPRQLRAVPSSPRSRVWLATLPSGPVVIKQIVDGPDAAHRFDREVTALRLAARADPPVVPALLGADPGNRVLVLRRLTGRQPADGWQVDYAATLARFHATGRYADAAILPAWTGPSAADVTAFLALAERLGVAVPARAADDLHALVERGARTAGQSLLHGDPCPDNLVLTRDGVRFLDLEQAALGDGLTELAYLHMGFPTCWCVTSVAAPTLRAAEQAYRDAWLAETGEPVRGDLTEACVGWLLRGDALVERARRGSADQFARLLRADWRWGTVTARQRLAYRLGVVADLSRGDGEHARTGELAAAMRTAVLGRWPGLRPPPSRVDVPRNWPSR